MIGSPIANRLLPNRLRRRYLFDAMRGYRKLRASGEFPQINTLKRALTVERLDVAPGWWGRRVLGAAYSQGELVTRQFLFSRLCLGSLNLTLLASVGSGRKAVVALPAKWRRLVEAHGFRVARVSSTLAWAGYVLLFFALGIRSVAKQFMRQGGGAAPRPYVYFEGLVADNIPSPEMQGEVDGILGWYLCWRGKPPRMDALCHGVTGMPPAEANGLPVLPVDEPFDALDGLGERLKFFGWAVSAVILGGIGLIAGRWWYAVTLTEGARAAVVRLQSRERLAEQYLFSNSSWVYRPHWTYEVEEKGVPINFYFYSTNAEAFKGPSGYPKPLYGWAAANWPLYLVWDEYQAAFVHRAVGETASVVVVGPVGWQCTKSPLPPLSRPVIAVFDVSAMRTAKLRSMCVETDYYVAETSERFLGDIKHAAEQTGYTIAWKRKRNISRMAHPRYRRLAKELAETETITAVQSETAPERLIEASELVIAMPFTSPAILARHMGKPSCYYDPLGVVLKDDRAAHGVPVVHGIEELEDWIERNRGTDSAVG